MPYDPEQEALDNDWEAILAAQADRHQLLVTLVRKMRDYYQRAADHEKYMLDHSPRSERARRLAKRRVYLRRVAREDAWLARLGASDV